jgi:hypothetical protein
LHDLVALVERRAQLVRRSPFVDATLQPLNFVDVRNASFLGSFQDDLFALKHLAEKSRGILTILL